MQPANATESDARLALYLCVDIFLIFLIFSYFPIFHLLRFPFHDDGRISLLLLFQFTLGAAQLKLLFINLATFTHSLKDCVACKRDFCFQFSVFFFVGPQRIRPRGKSCATRRVVKGKLSGRSENIFVPRFSLAPNCVKS